MGQARHDGFDVAPLRQPLEGCFEHTADRMALGGLGRGLVHVEREVAGVEPQEFEHGLVGGTAAFDS